MKDKITYRQEWLIKFNSIEDVKRFIQLTKEVPFEIDMCSIGRQRVIDAKSMMGILSLDLSIPHKLCTSYVGDEVDKYKESIKDLLVE